MRSLPRVGVLLRSRCARPVSSRCACYSRLEACVARHGCMLEYSNRGKFPLCLYRANRDWRLRGERTVSWIDAGSHVSKAPQKYPPAPTPRPPLPLSSLRRFQSPMLRRILPWTRERARRICIATLRASRNPPRPVGAACSRTRGRLILQILSSHRDTSRRRVSSWVLVNGALSPVGPRPSETPPRQGGTLCTQVPVACMHGFWLSGVPKVAAAL